LRLLPSIVSCHIETAKKFFSVLNGEYEFQNKENVNKFGFSKPRDVQSQLSDEAKRVGHLDMEIAFAEFSRKFESHELIVGSYVKEYAERFSKWIVLYNNAGSDDIEYRTIQSNCKARFNLFYEDLDGQINADNARVFNIVGKRG